MTDNDTPEVGGGEAVTDTTPRCYGHVFDPAHANVGHEFETRGWPAHVWSGGDSPKGCLWCCRPFTQGDRYVCVEGGILHAACVAPLDDAIAGIGGAL